MFCATYSQHGKIIRLEVKRTDLSDEFVQEALANLMAVVVPDGSVDLTEGMELLDG
jgi:hypothetical protein